MAKQRVTLYIDPDTWRMFRQLCLLDGISASAYAEHLMNQAVYDTNIPEQTFFRREHSTPDTTPEEGVSGSGDSGLRG